MSREQDRQREEEQEAAAQAAREAAQKSGIYQGEPGEQSTKEGKELLSSTPYPKDTSEPEPSTRRRNVYHGEPGEQTTTRLQDINPPKSAKLVEKTANNEPAVYQKDNTRYYAPGSTMYKMGFRTNEEYRRAQLRGASYGVHQGNLVPDNTIIMTDRNGKPLMRVTLEDLSKRGYQFALANQFAKGWYRYSVMDYEGKEVLLTPRQVEKIYNASDRQQFEYLLQAGILPGGTEYVGPDKKGDLWGYILPQKDQGKKLPEVKIPAPHDVELIQKPQEKAKVFATKQHLEKIAVNLGLSPKMAGVLPAAGVVAAAEPTASGEAIIGLIIIGGLAIAVATNKNIDLSGALQAAREAVADYKANIGHDPSIKDVLIVDGTIGKVMPLAEVVKMAAPSASLEEIAKQRPDIKPVQVQKWEPSIIKPVDIKPGEQLIPPEVDIKSMMVTKGVGPREIANILEQPIPGTNVKWQEPVVVLPGTSQAYPKRLINDTTNLMERAGMMVAAARATTSTLPLTRQQWEEIEESMRRADIDRMVKQMVENYNRLQAQKRITPEIARHYQAAYQEYLRRKAAYEEAKKAYIESLNPQPVRGKLSQAAIEAYATYLISQAAKGEKAKPGTNIDNYVAQLVNTDVQEVINSGTKAATEAYTKALAQGATETQAKTKAQTVAETAIQTKTKTITNAAVKQAVKTATGTLTATAVATATEAATTSAITTTTTTITTPVPKLKSGEMEPEEIRKLIKRTPGVVAWNMGKLGKPLRDVWHIKFPNGTHKVLLGKAPKGAKILADGPGSTYKTTQVIKGDLRREVKQKIGAVTINIKPSGKPKGAVATFTSNMPRLKSVKHGKLYYTNIGSNAVGISRKPIGRRHK